MVQNSPTQFVVDTHTLWWYLRASYRLSDEVAGIFRLAAAGSVTIIVPAIVVAEFYFLSVKESQPTAPSVLFDDMASIGGIELSDLGRAQLDLLDRLPEIPEIHDRLIAAESIHRNAPLLTIDRLLNASPNIETIW